MTHSFSSQEVLLISGFQQGEPVEDDEDFSHLRPLFPILAVTIASGSC